MIAQGGPVKVRRAKTDASVDSAEGMKDTPGISPERLHFDTFCAASPTAFLDPPPLAEKGKGYEWSQAVAGRVKT